MKKYEDMSPQDWYDLIGVTVVHLLKEGNVERTLETDKSLMLFSYYLREALGLQQPTRS